MALPYDIIAVAPHARQSCLDIRIREVTIHAMEKDKYRSAITVGMLVCSMLVLSTLFIGCGPCQPPPSPPCTHPHSEQAACYHYPHPNGTTYSWVLQPPPPATDSFMTPCPWDTAWKVLPDSVKCLKCGYMVYLCYIPPCTAHTWISYYHHDCSDGNAYSWQHPLPPSQVLGSGPSAVPCPDPEPCWCGTSCEADSVKCIVCRRVWLPPWDGTAHLKP